MKPFDFVFSIGSDCACAMHLRDCGLRDMSSPFDWVFGISLLARVKIIEDDVAVLLRLENLRKLVKEKDGDPKCDYYADDGSGFIHYHDFPVGVPLEEILPTVRAKYERRIRRFRGRLASGGRVLMVWWDKRTHEEDAAYFEAIRRMQAKFPACEFHLLAFQDDQTLPVGATRKERLSDRIEKVSGRFCPVPSVRGDVKLTAKYLRKVPVCWSIRKKALRRSCLRALIKFLAAFVVVKSVRKAVRAKLSTRFGVADVR